MSQKDRKFACFFHYLGPMISFGFHIDPVSPNIEIHLPLGFLKIGWEYPRYYDEENIRRVGYIDGKFRIQRYESVLEDFV